MSVKVCHLTSIHPPFDTRIFVKECSSLSRAGYNVSLIAVDVAEEQRNGVRILNVTSAGKGRISRMLFTTKRIFKRAIEEDALIYHFHDPELIPVALKLLKRGKKVIYDVHEDIPRQILAKYYIPVVLRKLISWFTERLENYASGKFSAIVTATPHIRDRFLKLNRNSVEVCNFPVPDELFSEVRLKPAQPEMCYIGSITRARGIVEMIKALEGVPYRFNLCGTFSPESLRDEVTSLPGWKQVHEYGFASRNEVKDVLARSSAGLVTLHPIINYLDAYPVKMFEYMAAGVAVISSDIPLWKSFIDETGAGICVNPLQPEAIRAAMLQLMSDADAAVRMGEKGRNAVATKYNWAEEEKKLLMVYKKLAS